MTIDDLFPPPPGDLDDDDRLFDAGGPWQTNVKMNMPFLRDFRYVEGFRRAAEVLVAHSEAHRADVDALAMPILFSYRQWIELRLKDLWLVGRRLAEQDADPLVMHDLRKLWGLTRPIIEKAWPEGDSAVLDRLGAILHELAALDGPTGTGFRYAVDRKGEPSLPDDLAVNLSHVALIMRKVERHLEVAALGLGDLLDWQREIHDYYSG